MKTKPAKPHIPEVPSPENLNDVILQLKYTGEVNTKMVEAAVHTFLTNRESIELAEIRDCLRTQFGKKITRVEAAEHWDRSLLLKIRFYYIWSDELQRGLEMNMEIAVPFRAATLFKRLSKRSRRSTSHQVDAV